MKALNKAVLENKDKQLKGFVVFLTDGGKAVEPLLTGLADKTGAHEIALTHLPRKSPSVQDYKVNLAPEVKNTVMIYRRKRITSKFVNLQADEKGLASLQTALAEVVK